MKRWSALRTRCRCQPLISNSPATGPLRFPCRQPASRQHSGSLNGEPVCTEAAARCGNEDPMHACIHSAKLGSVNPSSNPSRFFPLFSSSSPSHHLAFRSLPTSVLRSCTDFFPYFISPSSYDRHTKLIHCTRQHRPNLTARQLPPSFSFQAVPNLHHYIDRLHQPVQDSGSSQVPRQNAH